MSEIEYVSVALKDAGIDLTAPVIGDPNEKGLYYAFVKTKKDKKDVPHLQKRAASQVKENLASRDIRLEFIYSYDLNPNVAAGIRAIFSHFLMERLGDCFVAQDGDKVSIWVTPEGDITPDDILLLEQKSKDFLSSVGLRLGNIVSLKFGNLPSRYIILSVLRIKAPALVPEIVGELRLRNFDIPSDRWLSRALDAMRKANLVTRLKSGRYALSLEALRTLGTSKNAQSPDITRMLDLARRGG